MSPLTITLNHATSFDGGTVIRLFLNGKSSQGSECEIEVRRDLFALSAIGLTPARKNLEPVRKKVPAVELERLSSLLAGLKVPAVSEDWRK